MLLFIEKLQKYIKKTLVYVIKEKPQFAPQ